MPSRLIAALIVALAFIFSSAGRYPSVDQAELLLVAYRGQQYSSVMPYGPMFWAVQDAAVFLAQRLAVDLGDAYNAVCAFLALVAAMAISRTWIGRIEPWLTALLFALLTVTVSDAVFGQRDYLFVLFWLPYATMRATWTARVRNENGPACPPALEAGITFLAVSFGCMRPHFALWFLAVEGMSFLAARRIAWITVVAGTTAAAVQIGTLIVLSGLDDLTAALHFYREYYALYRRPMQTIVAALAARPLVLWGVGSNMIGVGLAWWLKHLRLLLVATMFALGSILTIATIFTRGFPRENYDLTIYLPAAVLIALFLRELAGARVGLSRQLASIAFLFVGVLMMMAAARPFASQAVSAAIAGRQRSLLAHYIIKHVPRDARIGFIATHGEGKPQSLPPATVALEAGRFPSGYFAADYLLLEVAIAKHDAALMRRMLGLILDRLRIDDPQWLFIRNTYSNSMTDKMPPDSRLDAQLRAEPEMASFLDHFDRVGEIADYTILRRAR